MKITPLIPLLFLNLHERICIVKAKIDNYNTWVDVADPEHLRSEIEQILEGSGFTILNFMEHHFQPQGYTSVWLLAESHCALHTFPEENKSYIEVSSCNTRLFVNFIERFTRSFNLIENHAE